MVTGRVKRLELVVDTNEMTVCKCLSMSVLCMMIFTASMDAHSSTAWTAVQGMLGRPFREGEENEAEIVSMKAYFIWQR